MSEELIQKGYTEHGIKIGDHEYYDLGNTTLDSLKVYKIISKKTMKVINQKDQMDC
jgi:hypothetical protein